MTTVFPVAQGATSHSGNLTPEIWASRTIVKFYDATVFAAISNSDYEGLISDMGDTVHIRTVPDISISDYSAGMTLTYEKPVSTVVDLLIDKGHYYAFSINDVEKIQSDMNYVEDWSADAGEQLADTIDTAILAAIYSDVHASNAGATAGAVTSSIDLGAATVYESVDKTNILDYIVDMGTVLDEQNVPSTGRWLVLPPIFAGMIKKSDLKDAALAGDATSVIRNGKLGTIDRFMIYSSNNIATGTDTVTVYNIIFGHPSALTFASQLVKNETLKNPNDFGDLLRGLQVYGYRVVQSKAIGHFYAAKG